MTGETNLAVEDLFSDSGPVDEQAILKTLMPLLTIQKSTNQIFFKDVKLTANERILAFALAKKLLKAKNIIENEMVNAIEICKSTGLKRGTVDPCFKALKESGLLVGKSEREIPNHQINKIIKMLTRKQ